MKDIADDAGMRAVDSGVKEMQEILDEEQDLFKASRTEQDEEIRGQMGIQDKTAFDPTTLRPRPVEFPE